MLKSRGGVKARGSAVDYKYLLFPEKFTAGGNVNIGKL